MRNRCGEILMSLIILATAATPSLAVSPFAIRGIKGLWWDGLEKYRLALPWVLLRFAGGLELTLGDLGVRKGVLGGVNALIVGNYLTTLGRDAQDDLDLLAELAMPVKELSRAL